MTPMAGRVFILMLLQLTSSSRGSPEWRNANHSAKLSSQQVPKLLDDFETLEGWKALPSEGAKMKIDAAQGKTGKAMVMEFDLTGAYGYTIAQKDFPLDLPSNYEFTFDMRAEAPVNNFEV